MPSQGDSFKKVQAGWPLSIPAETYNAFVDAALAEKNRQHDRTAGTSPIWRDSTIVRVQNNSASPLRQFGVLGIDAPAVRPAANLAAFQQSPMLAGSTPNFALHRGRFVVLIEPAGVGAIARAVIAGAAIVQLKMRHELHRFADVDDGQSGDLSSSHAGSAEILWVDAPAYLSQVSAGELSQMSPSELGGDDDDDDDGIDDDSDGEDGEDDDDEDSGDDLNVEEGDDDLEDGDADDNDDYVPGGLAATPLGGLSSSSLSTTSSSSLSSIGSGLRWAIVRIGVFSPNFLIGKANGGISVGESGPVKVLIGPPGSEVDSGVQETVASPYGGVTDGDQIGACWNGFGWYAVAEKCGS